MVKTKKQPLLYLCATPIGNLGDMTLRALEVLAGADTIACEDTRVSGKLLKHYQIRKELFAYHEHNKHEAGEALIKKMKAGQVVVLLSDAGMPGINDPGMELIRRCQEEEILYSVLPGPSAFITALVFSGMDSSSFSFRGFFPKNNKEKKKISEWLDNDEATTIFYETPHRINKTLAWIAEQWPKRELAVIREISKLYEEMIKGSAEEVLEEAESRVLKGEMVLIISGAKENDTTVYTDQDLDALFQRFQEQGATKKEAIAMMADYTGQSKNELYQRFMLK